MDTSSSAPGPLGRLLRGFATASADLLGAIGLRHLVLSRSLPPRHETLRLTECRDNVSIRIDRWGVPHIRAANAADLFLAQGYCHARDRFWQMELSRRVSRGELAEMFGMRAVDLDRTFRRLGFRPAAEREWTTVDEEIRSALNAYTAGVNAYLDRHPLPIEFTILRQRPRPWTVIDSLAVARYVAWNLSFGWETQLIRGRLVDLLGPEQAALAEPRGRWSAESGARSAKSNAGTTATRPSSLDLGAMGNGASNNWAVAPARSATNAALLANDPHLRPRIPAAWYVMHLQGGGYNVAGATMPGLIGVLAGHNERVAWGVTVAVAECQDLYIEKRHPERPNVFAAGTEWYEANIRQETIAVHRGPPVVENIVHTRHGPLLNGVLDIHAAGPPLSLKCTTDTGQCATRALLDLNRAMDWASFRTALKAWHFPAINFVYADVDGTIAYKFAGRVPIRAKDYCSTPVPGWEGAHEWVGEIPFDDLPEVVNPEDGVLATANSEPDAPCRHFLSLDFIDDHRKRRILEMLEANDRHTLDDLAAMHRDVVSLPAREVARRLYAGLDPRAHPELRHLAGWDGTLALDSTAAALYEVFRFQLLHRLYGHFPAEACNLLRGQGVSEALGYLGSVFHNQATSRVLRLLDELLATESGTRMVGEALREAVGWLYTNLGPSPDSWRWGRLHRIRFDHIVGRAAPWLDRLLRLSRGPFPIGGDSDTIAQCGIDPWHPFDGGMFAVSYRQLFDLGDWDEARFILPTGQSGHPGSPHYDDMLEAWRQGDYYPLVFHEKAIQEATTETIQINR